MNVRLQLLIHIVYMKYHPESSNSNPKMLVSDNFTILGAYNLFKRTAVSPLSDLKYPITRSVPKISPPNCVLVYFFTLFLHSNLKSLLVILLYLEHIIDIKGRQCLIFLIFITQTRSVPKI